MAEKATVRIDRKTKARLQKLAKATDRTESHLADEAIRSFVDVNEWQIAGIKAALKEADEGKFASNREVRAFFKKWLRNAH